MDATQEQSLFVIGSRAGMKQEEIEDCVQVQANSSMSSFILQNFLENKIPVKEFLNIY